LDKLVAKIDKLTSHAVSNDGSEVTLVFDAKHVGELALLMKTECLDDVMAALSQAKAAIQSKRGEPAAQSKPGVTAAQSKPGEPNNQVTLTVPKNWLVSADLQMHDVVLLIFNHKTDAQSGYALDADTAKKMAVGLVKNGDAVLAHKASRAVAPKPKEPGP